ncbi:MAG: hypothetical protein ACI4XM_08205 [Candidatus Coprovivens sp.]
MKKLTYEDVKNYIESFGYVLLSKEYTNNRTNLKMKCDNEHECEISLSNFKKGRRCKHCKSQKLSEQFKIPYEEVKEYIESFGYELLSKEYVNANEYILINPPCEHEAYEVTFSAFKNQGQRCPKCANEHRNDNKKSSYEEIKKEFEKEGYKLLSEEYENSKKKLSVQCPKGHKYETSYGNFQQGKRCPHCNESKGEKEIEDILNKYQVNFCSQYKFDNCRLQRRLPFDFYLPQYNCCIEFDGEQHYKIVEYWGGLDGFVSRVIRDTIKNEYCKNNNIKLIRIRYEEIDSIEEILIDELNL